MSMLFEEWKYGVSRSHSSNFMMITSHEIKELTTHDIVQGNKRGVIQKIYITKQFQWLAYSHTHTLLAIHAGSFLLHYLPSLKERPGLPVNNILSRPLSENF